MTDADIRAIRALLEAFAEHEGICVHQWQQHKTRWQRYDQCAQCGRKRDRR